MNALLDRLEGLRETGPDRWLARCPAHDDRSPSLSIRDAGEKFLVHCFAGCDALSVVHAVGLELSDLFADAPAAHHGRPSRRRIPATDVLAALDHEAHVVVLIAADMQRDRVISSETWDRLALAVSRIGNARAMR